jgi:PAS domain S-box-containing protein
VTGALRTGGTWRGTPAILAAVVLAISGAVTYSSWRGARRDAENDLRAEFEFRVHDTQARIAERMRAYVQVLRGVAALFSASQRVERREFHVYVVSLEVPRNYPGIQGVGYGLWVPAGAVAHYAETLRKSGMPSYPIRPPGERPEYAPVLYLEPADGLNLRAFGYDMLSESVRRAALEEARDTGDVVLSGKITLVYDQNTSGALLYQAVYRTPPTAGAVEERRALLAGWVYASFRMNDLMRGIFGENESALGISLFDGPAPSAATLLFDNDRTPTERRPPPRFTATRRVEVAGHPWTLAVHSLPAFEARQNVGKHRVIAAIGAAASLLLTLLVWVLASARVRAVRHAVEISRRAEALHESEEALRRSEQFYRAVLRSSTDFWSVIDANNAYRRIGSNASAVVGWTEEELRSQDRLETVHPEDREALRATFQSAVAEPGSTRRLVYRFRHKDGSWRVLDTVARNLLDDPTVQGVVVNRRDVTEQRRLEEQLRQAQKLESIGRLAGGVAHDFNNILTVIMSCAAEMEQDLASGAPIQGESLRDVITSSERARDLTRQLLAFARKQVIEPVPLDLNRVVQGSEKLLRRILGEDVTFRSTLSDGLWTARGDVGQMEQLILNLAVNARDAMPKGGALTIETRNVAVAGDVAVPPGDYVQLLLSDSGAGMTPEVKSHLFEPFFTTKPQGQGTGLGLATVYGIVTQSEGYIRVQSEPGQGTTFQILFPRTLERPAPPRTLPGEPAPGGKETVLLVEDEPLVRHAAVRALEAAGYTVLVVSDGEEALALDPARLQGARLLITDVVMPGMDGATLAGQLRGRHPALSVLFISGYTRDALARHGVLDSGVSFLPKPFTGAELLARVREVLLGGG